MTAPLKPITDEIIDQIASADDQHIATDFFRRLCNQAKEANKLRELLREVLSLLHDEWDGTRETSSGNKLIAQIEAVLGKGETNGN